MLWRADLQTWQRCYVMAKFFELQVRMKKRTIDEVPDRWREETRKLLEKEKGETESK